MLVSTKHFSGLLLIHKLQHTADVGACNITNSASIRTADDAGVTLVDESGITSVAEARRLCDTGADAMLVGEATMRGPALIAKLSALP